MTPRDVSAGIRVASWPGKGDAQNPFLKIFLGGLEKAGCHVESLETVEAVTKAMKATPDILLLHWPERVFAESHGRWQILTKIRRLLAAIASARRSGTRVVWMVHNLAPHDPPRFQKLLWPAYARALAQRVSAFMTLAPGTVAQVRAGLSQLASKPGYWVWHPAYPDAALTSNERNAVRTAHGFGPNDRVLGYCGQIRPNKGLEELLKTFRRTDERNLRLVVAGLPMRGRQGEAPFVERLRQDAGADDRITLRFANLAAEEYRGLIGACDVVVAPFQSYLHSGSIVYAISAGRAVLTPETPFSRSYSELFGSERVRTYGGALTPELLERQQAGDPVSPDLSDIESARVGRMARRAFADIMGEETAQ